MLLKSLRGDPAGLSGRVALSSTNKEDDVVFFSSPTSLNNSSLPVQVKRVMALNVLVNKWSSNWELIVTVGQHGRPVIMAFIVTINFHIVVKHNLRSPSKYKKKLLCAQMWNLCVLNESGQFKTI